MKIKEKKIIGIDFDNTIACYDAAFYKAAIEKNIIPHDIDPSKNSIRNYLRNIQKEDDWTKLQGYIYGSRMDLAFPFEGIDNFINKKNCNQILFIISHKTKHPYLGPKYDLHKETLNWIQKKDFFQNIDQIFLELTLTDKLNRIKKQNCDFFIDDLPELLLHKDFPKNTKKILFDPQNAHINNSNYYKFSSWTEIKKHIDEND